MSIYEYDEKKAKKYYFSEGYEDGYDEGKSASLLENVASIMKRTLTLIYRKPVTCWACLWKTPILPSRIYPDK